MPTPVPFCQGEDVGLLSSGADGPVAATSKGHMNGFFRRYQGALSSDDRRHHASESRCDCQRRKYFIARRWRVDGAHRAARPGLLAKYLNLGGCPPGEARLPGGHHLPASHVIHAVGPIWQVEPPGSNKSWKAAISHVLKSPSRRDFAISRFLLLRQVSTAFRAKQPSASP